MKNTEKECFVFCHFGIRSCNIVDIVLDNETHFKLYLGQQDEFCILDVPFESIDESLRFQTNFE